MNAHFLWISSHLESLADIYPLNSDVDDSVLIHYRGEVWKNLSTTFLLSDDLLLEKLPLYSIQEIEDLLTKRCSTLVCTGMALILLERYDQWFYSFLRDELCSQLHFKKSTQLMRNLTKIEAIICNYNLRLIIEAMQDTLKRERLREIDRLLQLYTQD